MRRSAVPQLSRVREQRSAPHVFPLSLRPAQSAGGTGSACRRSLSCGCAGAITRILFNWLSCTPFQHGSDTRNVVQRAQAMDRKAASNDSGAQPQLRQRLRPTPRPAASPSASCDVANHRIWIELIAIVTIDLRRCHRLTQRAGHPQRSSATAYL